MSKPTVYVDTNIFSYLHYIGSDEVLIEGQQLTRYWWKNERQFFKLFASRVVEKELTAGGFLAQPLALAEVRRLLYLPFSAAVQTVGQRLIDSRVIPESEQEDAIHLAFATVHGIGLPFVLESRAFDQRGDTSQTSEISSSKRIPDTARRLPADYPENAARRANSKERLKMQRKVELGINDDIILRSRRARKELFQRFGSFDAYCDYLESLEKQPRKGRAAKRATASKRGTKRPARNGKPIPKKPAHKA
jgi:hypothetical protein